MYKKTAYAALSLALMGGALIAPAVASAASMPIVGWAWSAGADSVPANNVPKEAEFTGWIQFAPLYYDFNNDGAVDSADTSAFMPTALAGGPCPTGKICDLPGTSSGITSADALALGRLVTAGTLGVYEDTTTGDLAGYAWSENLGWVSFNASEVAGCPLTTPRNTCAPYVDKTNGRLMGWARACSAFTSGCSGDLNPNAGVVMGKTGPKPAWDGFISLSGTASNGAPYGVSQDESCNWSGAMSWGDSTLNWVSFEGPNYSVHAATTDPTACKVANTLPNLVAGGVSAGGVQTLPNIGVAYSTVVSNIGLSSTTRSFYTVLQRTDSYDPITKKLTGPYTNIKHTNFTGRLGPDVRSTTINFAKYTFSTADVGTKHWLRACADRNLTDVSVIAEGSTDPVVNAASLEENDNCGEWTEIFVNGPDLGVVGLEPANATVGTPVTFDATLTNGGATATGIFGSSVYICLATDETCKNQVDAIRVASTWWEKLIGFFYPRAFAADPPKATLTSASGIGAGASGHQFGNYTFADKGTYTLLLCADKPLNEIRENNEKDNCGDWKIFVVGPAVNPPNTPCSKSICGVTTNGVWDASGTVCSAPEPVPPPGACTDPALKPAVDIRAVPPRVRKDRNTAVTVSWDATNVKTCDIKGGAGGSAISVLGDTPPVSDSRGVIVNALTKYTITCLGADDSTVSTSTTVNLQPIPEEF